MVCMEAHSEVEFKSSMGRKEFLGLLVLYLWHSLYIIHITRALHAVTTRTHALNNFMLEENTSTWFMNTLKRVGRPESDREAVLQ